MGICGREKGGVSEAMSSVGGGKAGVPETIPYMWAGQDREF